MRPLPRVTSGAAVLASRERTPVEEVVLPSLSVAWSGFGDFSTMYFLAGDAIVAGAVFLAGDAAAVAATCLLVATEAAAAGPGAGVSTCLLGKANIAVLIFSAGGSTAVPTPLHEDATAGGAVHFATFLPGDAFAATFFLTSDADADPDADGTTDSTTLLFFAGEVAAAAGRTAFLAGDVAKGAATDLWTGLFEETAATSSATAFLFLSGLR